MSSGIGPASTHEQPAEASPVSESPAGYSSQEQDPDDEPEHFHRRQLSGVHPESAWAQQNVLTFDGGGVRGYYSLLQLQKLFEYIEIEEKAQNERLDAMERMRPEDLSSFSPCGQPRHMSHCPTFRPYLPCHYFDYIGGTSTGALITTMLARLRMPVEDCLDEYKRLAGSIFGSPRWVHKVGFPGLVINKNKFSTANLEGTIKDVIRRRGEAANVQDEAMLLTTQKGLCRAIIVVDMSAPKDGGSGRVDAPWIFRSYDNFHKDTKPKTDQDHAVLQRVDTESFLNAEGPRNAGQGTKFAAWKVARAATAAPLYFKPLEVALDDGEVVSRKTTIARLTRTFAVGVRAGSGNAGSSTAAIPERTARFTDGGFGRANNPSEEVLRELKSILKKRYKKIGTWVSIGTARPIPKSDPKRQTLHNTTLLSYAKLGDPEPVNEMMKMESREKFAYYRLNEVNGLPGVDMDEWQPRHSGEATMEKMKNAFATWASEAENVERFQECARALVRNRRERARESMSLWERYAMGRFYFCPESDCIYDPDETWHYRSTFERHLGSVHRKNAAAIRDTLDKCEYCWEYKPPKPHK
ncbi:acyl transferase/acyl hydrolase/lysophospholipase [Lasiosphaeria miniovina]|uniref:Acyl transferase/acyl hydrolase/lysophospholipase n=1 Tax=Lasiosphaeria miniovina TaxID=1954250 RepID=A0AA40DSB8_9PEZI|nr:acyl transferase/acyl hydrolase/lysophospholipase [Lasiosphaeria miniovina]KAK0713705.1 acyl transferase/acyl hydrolase/lysophospholipase [Lasiosphaeria miniovina]